MNIKIQLLLLAAFLSGCAQKEPEQKMSKKEVVDTFFKQYQRDPTQLMSMYNNYHLYTTLPKFAYQEVIGDHDPEVLNSLLILNYLIKKTAVLSNNETGQLDAIKSKKLVIEKMIHEKLGPIFAKVQSEEFDALLIAELKKGFDEPYDYLTSNGVLKKYQDMSQVELFVTLVAHLEKVHKPTYNYIVRHSKPLILAHFGDQGIASTLFQKIRNKIISADQAPQAAPYVAEPASGATTHKFIVIMGDSVNDEGLRAKQSKGLGSWTAPEHGFYMSRYSDAHIWVDYLRVAQSDPNHPLAHHEIINLANGGGRLHKQQVKLTVFDPSKPAFTPIDSITQKIKNWWSETPEPLWYQSFDLPAHKMSKAELDVFEQDLKRIEAVLNSESTAVIKQTKINAIIAENINHDFARIGVYPQALDDADRDQDLAVIQAMLALLAKKHPTTESKLNAVRDFMRPYYRAQRDMMKQIGQAYAKALLDKEAVDTVALSEAQELFLSKRGLLQPNQVITYMGRPKNLNQQVQSLVNKLQANHIQKVHADSLVYFSFDASLIGEAEEKSIKYAIEKLVALGFQKNHIVIGRRALSSNMKNYSFVVNSVIAKLEQYLKLEAPQIVKQAGFLNTYLDGQFMTTVNQLKAQGLRFADYYLDSKQSETVLFEFVSCIGNKMGQYSTSFGPYAKIDVAEDYRDSQQKRANPALEMPPLMTGLQFKMYGLKSENNARSHFDKISKHKLKSGLKRAYDYMQSEETTFDIDDYNFKFNKHFRYNCEESFFFDNYHPSSIVHRKIILPTLMEHFYDALGVNANDRTQVELSDHLFEANLLPSSLSGVDLYHEFRQLTVPRAKLNLLYAVFVLGDGKLHGNKNYLPVYRKDFNDLFAQMKRYLVKYEHQADLHKMQELQQALNPE